MNSRMFSLVAFCFSLPHFFFSNAKSYLHESKKDLSLLLQKREKKVKNTGAKEEKAKPTKRIQKDVERKHSVSKAIEASILF